MKLEVRHEYAKSSREVYELFISEGFQEKKFAACGHRKIEVTNIDNSDDEYAITVEREVPVDVPGALKSILSDWNKMTQTDTWEDVGDEEFVCEYSIKSSGVPATITGSMTLMPGDDGCTNDIDFEVRCGIPLLGRKVEQLIIKDAEKNLDAEFDFIASELGLE